MATPTYTPIASITLGSSASSVTFSSIPQDYRDLVLVVNGTTSSESSVEIQFNGDTSTDYSLVRMIGVGGSTTSNITSGRIFIVQFPTISTSITQIMDYSATDKHTTILSRNGSASASLSAEAGRYAKTAAITSIKLEDNGGATFNTGSTLALYGIAS